MSPSALHILISFGLTFFASDAIGQSHQVLKYLYKISGVKTVAGQHNQEPNTDPDRWTEYIYKVTGKYPALWSGDFLYQQENIDKRWTMIREAKRQWDMGAIVNIMWHACPPHLGEPCKWDPGVLNAKMSDAQWNDLITEGTPLNRTWKKRMDDISIYLGYLKENGVEVLFRPFHEMNIGAFWWGDKPGPRGAARLYQLTRDYMVNEKKLTNLIWVWDMQDVSKDFEEYNPGNDYWDVFAFDVYGPGYDSSWYNYILPIVKNKPIAIGECSKLPGTDFLSSQPRWTFIMPWAGMVKENNTDEAIRKFYADERVITRDEMPGWDLKTQKQK
jgi:mannan endo-1,4-beta-mannosidase